MKDKTSYVIIKWGKIYSYYHFLHVYFITNSIINCNTLYGVKNRIQYILSTIQSKCNGIKKIFYFFTFYYRVFRDFNKLSGYNIRTLLSYRNFLISCLTWVFTPITFFTVSSWTFFMNSLRHYVNVYLNVFLFIYYNN